MMISNVEQARRQLTIAMAVLLVLDVALIAVLLSPLLSSGRARREELAALRSELAIKRVQTIPALDMDKKLAEARQQISDFYTRDFPGRYSEISATLAKAAEASHVEVANVKYDTKPPSGRLAQVNISLDLGGNYENEIRFINALERSKLLLVIESVNQAESQSGGIRLSLKLQTFLRTAES
jgi:Tfp pilus assembly protein PilO